MSSEPRRLDADTPLDAARDAAETFLAERGAFDRSWFTASREVRDALLASLAELRAGTGDNKADADQRASIDRLEKLSRHVTTLALANLAHRHAEPTPATTDEDRSRAILDLALGMLRSQRPGAVDDEPAAIDGLAERLATGEISQDHAAIALLSRLRD